jgi:hypothetical protein
MLSHRANPFMLSHRANPFMLSHRANPFMPRRARPSRSFRREDAFMIANDLLSVCLSVCPDCRSFAIKKIRP